MHQITFYPVGNGDTSLITLSNNKHILLDYRQHANATDKDKPEFDISVALNKALGKKSSFDVVAFTHADNDHIEGSIDYFYLEHSKKYQDDCRKKIDELWVPAAMLLESASKDKQSNEFVLWRQEARYRLKNKKDIKVFSKPDDLKKLIALWGMNENELDDYIIDAGTIVDTFSLKNDSVEFFVHSPFMKHCDDETGKDIKKVRNQAALIFNVRFKAGVEFFDFLAVGDSEHEVLDDIVGITKYKKNTDRLAWDIFNIPHHCSYLALSNEKDDKETQPTAKVQELLEMGKKDAYIICSSKAFKTEKDALIETQPPHLQAKRCYETYLKKIKGRKFLVTMENEGTKNPQPITIYIDKDGLSMKKLKSASHSTAMAIPPRAGK
jgi:hypothetical protein